jgi:hypothetical protein
MSPDEIERIRDHSMVRHVFFSDVQKRLELPSEIVDEVTEELLAALEDGKDRAKKRNIHPSGASSISRSHAFLVNRWPAKMV